MKKLLLLFCSIFLIFSIESCSSENSKYINFTTKPNNHYYSSTLLNKIILNEDFKIYVFDTNVYKEISVDKTYNYVLENFLTSLTTENYINEEVPEKEPFRIKIVFNDNEKYVFKVYNKDIISVFPWDGTYKEDIISMNDLPLRYNLFDFCNHIQNKPLSKPN